MSENTTCDYLIANGAIPHPDADVSGIGVLLAFLLSAYITFLAMLGAYIFGYIDPELLRPVDTLVHRVPQKKNAKQARKVMETFVMLLSDQQIVTGTAILIAGFVGLGGKMSVYHFQIVIYLAWMASSVHLSALTMMSSFFAAHRAVMNWRLFGMTVMSILLLIALIPTSSNLWAINQIGPYVTDTPGVEGDDRVGWGIPAKCFFFKNHGFGVNPDGPFGIILLLISYIWKICGLFKTTRSGYVRVVRAPPEKFLEKHLHRLAVEKKSSNKRGFNIRYNLTLTAYVWLVLQNEVLSSFAASLHLSWIGLVFGTIQIVVPRIQNDWWASKEDEWEFGQIVPLVLLIQPLGVLLEHVGRTAQSADEEEEHGKEEEVEEQYDLTELGGSYKDRLAHGGGRGHLSAIFANLREDSGNDRSDSSGPLDTHLALFRSKLFKCLVVWIELGGTGVTAWTFYWDYLSIGVESTANWYGVLTGLGIVVASTLVLIVAGIPFSRIFR